MTSTGFPVEDGELGAVLEPCSEEFREINAGGARCASSNERCESNDTQL
jgi:hypothetical protein